MCQKFQFILGHNLFSDIDDFAKAIDLLSKNLDIQISDAIVIEFEFGVVLKSIFSIKHQKLLHLDSQRYLVRTYESEKWFILRDFMVRLYDAGETFSKKVKHYIQKRLKENEIFNP